MSASLLREAAAKMRERAEAAQPATDGDAWVIDYSDQYARNHEVYSGPLSHRSRDVASATDDETAEHIASWHPAVALAVADWLDSEAHAVDDVMAGNHTTAIYVGPSFEVARAYLGEQS